MKYRKEAIYFFGLGFIIFLMDQLSKGVVRRNIKLGEEVQLGPFLSLTHTSNTGAGFSLLQGQNTLLIWVAIIALGVILFFLDEFDSREVIYMGMAFGGILGNLADRVFIGSVTDFVDFHFWPVFNLADSALCIGLIGYAIISLMNQRLPVKKSKGKR